MGIYHYHRVIPVAASWNWRPPEKKLADVIELLAEQEWVDREKQIRISQLSEAGKVSRKRLAFDDAVDALRAGPGARAMTLELEAPETSATADDELAFQDGRAVLTPALAYLGTRIVTSEIPLVIPSCSIDEPFARLRCRCDGRLTIDPPGKPDGVLLHEEGALPETCGHCRKKIQPKKLIGLTSNPMTGEFATRVEAPAYRFAIELGGPKAIPDGRVKTKPDLEKALEKMFRKKFRAVSHIS